MRLLEWFVECLVEWSGVVYGVVGGVVCGVVSGVMISSYLSGSRRYLCGSSRY